MRSAVIGRVERFGKSMTESVMRPGDCRVGDSFWRQRLVAEVSLVGKNKVHYVIAAGYLLVLSDVAQKLSYDKE